MYSAHFWLIRSLYESFFFFFFKYAYRVNNSSMLEFYKSIFFLPTQTVSPSFVCLFLHRKLHCTRNFIHMNLFVSFILRAISVFIKDGVLYAQEDSEHCFIHTVSTIVHAYTHFLAHLTETHCASWVSLPFLKLECRAVMIFFHYCVLSNYFWLFIEGLYLFTLLVETFFPERRYFYWYIIIGWGKNLPTI